MPKKQSLSAFKAKIAAKRGGVARKRGARSALATSRKRKEKASKRLAGKKPERKTSVALPAKKSMPAGDGSKVRPLPKPKKRASIGVAKKGTVRIGSKVVSSKKKTPRVGIGVKKTATKPKKKGILSRILSARDKRIAAQIAKRKERAKKK